MLKRRPNPHALFPKTRRKLSTCPLPLDPLTPSLPPPPPAADHKTLCLSLIEQLIHRGLFSSAQRVMQRIIVQCPSTPDVISAIEFAAFRGMHLDVRSFGVLIRKLVASGQPRLAEAVYYESVVGRDIKPDPSILNSMVICFCRLGKLDEARAHFDKILLANLVPCIMACNVLLQELCFRVGALVAFDYFIKIDSVGGVVSFPCFNGLIDGLCFRGHLDEALKVFDITCTKNGIPPTAHLYKSLFYALCERGRVLEAESFCVDMECSGFVVDKVMYTKLMSEYCKDRKMKMAMRVFFRMLKTGCDPDKYTYKTLIHGFVKLGLIDTGWVLYNQMVESGLQPDVVTYHIMITGYCREHKLDCALALFNSMSVSSLVPTVHFYTVLIAALIKENRLTEVEEMYKKMLDRGVVPDHVLFFTLMLKCPKGHELQLALMVLQAVAQNGCRVDPYLSRDSVTPNLTGDLEQEIKVSLRKIVQSNLSLACVAFSIGISALCAAGKTDGAVGCMDNVMSLGCRPLLSSYNSLIKSLCQEGLVEDANLLLELMQDRGMVPNLATYLVMACEHCKQKDLASAFAVLSQMDKSGLRPNAAIYDTIIGCLSKEKRILEAEDMFKRMLEAGVYPDEVVYITMINAYSKNGRAVEACELFDKMIKYGVATSSHTYTALINGLIKKNMIKKGCLYLDRMLEEGFVPNTVLFTALINQYLRKGDMEFAFRLVELMELCKIECDLITYIALISGVSRNILITRKKSSFVSRRSERDSEFLLYLLCQKTLPRRHNLRVVIKSHEEMQYFVLKLMRNISETWFMPNLYLYNGIIAGLCRAGRMQDAYDYLELMQMDGIRPNEVSFTILMSSHIKHNDVDHAIKLFNKMNANGCTPDQITYNTFICGLCNNGRLLDALSVSHLMCKKGLFPNMLSCKKLVNCLCTNGLSTEAFNFYQDMIDHDYVPSRYYHNLLLYVLCEDQKISEAHFIFDTMLKRGKNPDEIARRLLVEAISRHEKCGEPSRMCNGI